ncbi:MAG: CBS domain-containing protein [Bacteriovorax sp.]
MNRVRDFMTEDPVCCLPTTNLKVVAKLMVQYDCGEIPVVYSIERPKVVGVITDRDITCRSVAHGLNPLEMIAEDIMTTPALVVTMDMSLEDCCTLMKEEKIRRVPVVDTDEFCCGMISIADIARKSEDLVAASMIHDISMPTYDFPMEVS